MPVKLPSLHQRLNDLENELKELHDRILTKRQLFKHGNVFSRTKLQSKNPVQKEKCRTALEKSTLDHKGNNGHIKGRDLNGKTASLTEITSLSSGLQLLQSAKKNEKYNVHGLKFGECVYPKKKSKFVLSNKLIHETIGKTLSEIFELQKGIAMQGTSSEFTTATSAKQAMKNEIHFDTGTLGREMEDRMLDLKMLKERIETVKKKLRDERTKREIAERAITGYRRRIAILEGKNSNKEEKGLPDDAGKNMAPFMDLLTTFKKQLQEENSNNRNAGKDAEVETKKTLELLEKELNEERKKRQEAEKLVKELQKSLEESQKTVMKLEEGRKLAVSMADQFRDKAAKIETQEIENLKCEKAALEMELKCLKETNGVSPNIVQKLIERAERAEKELIEKMKQCNNFMAKSSLNDPEVVKLIEKHKKAYAQLQTEKKSKEAELKNRCNGLIKDIETATVAADKRFKEISDKHTLVVDEIKKKEAMIDKMKNEKKVMENEIRNLKNKLQEVAEKKEHQEESIKSLKDKIELNDEHVEKIKKELKDSKAHYSSLEVEYNKLQKLVVEQEKTIEKMRSELDHEKDSVKIKDKMLQDQADTIRCLRIVADNTKKDLDAERIEKNLLENQIDKLEYSREKLSNKLATLESQLKEKEEERIKEEGFLKELEHKVRQKHVEWQLHITQVSQEKEKAINTARFATEKLVKAINDYEHKLNAQKKIQGLLNSALREKEYQLKVAKQQVQELNEEVWKSALATENVRNELQTKLKRACEVCTDVIDTYVEIE